MAFDPDPGFGGNDLTTHVAATLSRFSGTIVQNGYSVGGGDVALLSVDSRLADSDKRIASASLTFSLVLVPCDCTLAFTPCDSAGTPTGAPPFSFSVLSGDADLVVDLLPILRPAFTGMHYFLLTCDEIVLVSRTVSSSVAKVAAGQGPSEECSVRHRAALTLPWKGCLASVDPFFGRSSFSMTLFSVSDASIDFPVSLNYLEPEGSSSPSGGGPSPFTRCWRLSFLWRVVQSGGSYLLTDGDGYVHLFQRASSPAAGGSALFYEPGGRRWLLRESDPGMELLFPDGGSVSFDSAGLSSVLRPAGQFGTAEVAYDAQGRPASLHFPASDRTVAIAYSGSTATFSLSGVTLCKVTVSSGRVSSVRDSRNDLWSFSHKASLTSIPCDRLYSVSSGSDKLLLSYDDDRRCTELITKFGSAPLESLSVAYGSTATVSKGLFGSSSPVSRECLSFGQDGSLLAACDPDRGGRVLPSPISVDGSEGTFSSASSHPISDLCPIQANVSSLGAPISVAAPIAVSLSASFGAVRNGGSVRLEVYGANGQVQTQDPIAEIEIPSSHLFGGRSCRVVALPASLPYDRLAIVVEADEGVEANWLFSAHSLPSLSEETMLSVGQDAQGDGIVEALGGRFSRPRDGSFALDGGASGTVSGDMFFGAVDDSLGLFRFHGERALFPAGQQGCVDVGGCVCSFRGADFWAEDFLRVATNYSYAVSVDPGGGLDPYVVSEVVSVERERVHKSGSLYSVSGSRTVPSSPNPFTYLWSGTLDGSFRPLAATDEMGVSTAWSRNPAGQVLREDVTGVRPSGQNYPPEEPYTVKGPQRVYSHLQNGQVGHAVQSEALSIDSASAVSLSYGYDALGRPASVSDGAGVLSVSYSGDEATGFARGSISEGEVLSSGRVCSLYSGNNTTRERAFSGASSTAAFANQTISVEGATLTQDGLLEERFEVASGASVRRRDGLGRVVYSALEDAQGATVCSRSYSYHGGEPNSPVSAFSDGSSSLSVGYRQGRPVLMTEKVGGVTARKAEMTGGVSYDANGYRDQTLLEWKAPWGDPLLTDLIVSKRELVWPNRPGSRHRTQQLHAHSLTVLDHSYRDAQGRPGMRETDVHGPLGSLAQYVASYAFPRFAEGNTDFEGPLPASETFVAESSGTLTLSTSFLYDAQGRISEVRHEQEGYGHRYYRDSSGRLIREEPISKSGDDWSAGQAIYYAYDAHGNVTEVRFGDYEVDVSASYSADGTVSSQGYSYDRSLYPTLYRNASVSWAAGRPSSFGTTQFSYDGSRLSQYSDGALSTSLEYRYGRLFSETVQSGGLSTALEFVYGADGGLVGFVLGGEYYHYRKNILGDVVAIYRGIARVASYDYTAFGRCEVRDASGQLDSNPLSPGNANPFRYKGLRYIRTLGMYWVGFRLYDPMLGRFVSPDPDPYLGPDGSNGVNPFVYCRNDPITYVDPTGHFPILAVILGMVALTGLGLTIGGVVSDNNVMTAVGLGMVGGAAMFSGGIALGSAIGSGAILSGVVGGVTMLAGGGSLMFMSAEIQEASGSGNWIMDSTGMSDDFYNALLLTTATTAALGTIASSVAHSFDIRSIQGIARYGDYYGLRFTTGAGKTRVLSFHTHSHTFKGPLGWHWQLTKYNPYTGKTSGTIARWLWWCLLHPW